MPFVPDAMEFRRDAATDLQLFGKSGSWLDIPYLVWEGKNGMIVVDALKLHTGQNFVHFEAETFRESLASAATLGEQHTAAEQVVAQIARAVAKTKFWFQSVDKWQIERRLEERFDSSRRSAPVLAVREVSQH